MSVNYPCVSVDGVPKRINNIYCIGRNYAEHAKELNNPVPAKPLVFLKANASVRSIDACGIAFADDTFHHELELVLMVTKNVAMFTKPQLSMFGAFGLGLDMTRREVQSELKKDGHPWTLAKSFQGSAIIAPMTSLSEHINLSNLEFGLEVSGTRRQFGNTSDMLTPPIALLEYLLSFNDLYAGDLIFTGTPKGVGPIKSGESFRIWIEGRNYSYDGII